MIDEVNKGFGLFPLVKKRPFSLEDIINKFDKKIFGVY